MSEDPLNGSLSVSIYTETVLSFPRLDDGDGEGAVSN